MITEITIPCPRCGARVEPNLYRNHLRNCAPQKRSAEPSDVADDNDLHPRTAYEQRVGAENFRRGITPAPAKLQEQLQQLRKGKAA